MSGFVPCVFIDVGETGAFFTLRQTYLHERWVAGDPGYMVKEVRSYHHFNLSQDADEAFEKATEFAEQHAIPLESTRETLRDEMRKIQRAGAEEMERRERERQERMEAWAAERAAEEQRKRELIMNGVFPFGELSGKPFSEATRGYLTWLADSVNNFEDGSLLQLLAQQVIEQCAHLLFPKPDPTLTIGAPAQRREFNVTVIKSRYFDREAYNTGSYYGRPPMERVFVVTFIDKETNACLLFKGTSFNATEGDKLVIKATVKEHSEYKGQAQTVIQRIKVLNKLI